jgi:hypothetical protein
MARNAIEVRDCDNLFDKIYDCAILAIGYEQRSTYIGRSEKVKALRRVALGYNENRILRYSENKQWYQSHEYEVQECSDSDFKSVFKHEVFSAGQINGKNEQQFLIDISSFNRFRLATMVELLREHELEITVSVDFAYCLAKYSAPPAHTALNRHVGPVNPYFSGWWTEPELPSAAFVGLGYEEDKALGALEHLQPSEIWAFLPSSPVSEYTPALHQANCSVIEMIRGRVVGYDVDQPFDLFTKLESLIAGVGRRSNCILLPFGPKIFALCALLVACLHPHTAVWRVSGAEEAADRVGHSVYGISGTFPPSSELVGIGG